MARRPLSMRKTREILRLKHELGLSNRQIAASLHMSHVCVANYLRRAEEAGVGWPLPLAIDEEELRRLLFASQNPPEKARRSLPASEYLHQQLRRKGVTLRLLWEEYRRQEPGGYGYTQFCEYYQRFSSQLEPSLRQVYKAGERMLVDWAGLTVPLVGSLASGENPEAHLFVAVLGASNYTFVEAFADEQLASWIEGHIHAWEFFGGVAHLTIPDNPRTAVIHACRYEPELNASYRELAEHYGTVILPARVRKPQDKAKAEAAVQNAERRILAVLRDRRFFSVAEVNQAIRPELQALNERPFQKMSGSRAQWFLQLEKSALLPLPAVRYELATWSKAKVNIDYHVSVDWHNYSVPYRLIHQEVEVRLSARTAEIFHRGQRVALHPRSNQRGKFTTDAAHRPKSHQRYLEWTPTRLIQWAQKEVGPECSRAATHILEHKPHPEQGYRSCLGLMRLSRRYGRERLERDCTRALALGVCSYRSIRSILDARWENQAWPPQALPLQTPIFAVHPNLRGGVYYQ